MKSILALHADAPKRTPLYMYMGSANFSAAAWGTVMPELRNGVVAKTLAIKRLAGVKNFECGVVIRGRDIAGMLETGNWEDIVPYVRPKEADVCTQVLPRPVKWFVYFNCSGTKKASGRSKSRRRTSRRHSTGMATMTPKRSRRTRRLVR